MKAGNHVEVCKHVMTVPRGWIRAPGKEIHAFPKRLTHKSMQPSYLGLRIFKIVTILRLQTTVWKCTRTLSITTHNSAWLPQSSKWNKWKTYHATNIVVGNTRWTHEVFTCLWCRDLRGQMSWSRSQCRARATLDKSMTGNWGRAGKSAGASSL